MCVCVVVSVGVGVGMGVGVGVGVGVGASADVGMGVGMGRYGYGAGKVAHVTPVSIPVGYTSLKANEFPNNARDHQGATRPGPPNTETDNLVSDKTTDTSYQTSQLGSPPNRSRSRRPIGGAAEADGGRVAPRRHNHPPTAAVQSRPF